MTQTLLDILLRRGLADYLVLPEVFMVARHRVGSDDTTDEIEAEGFRAVKALLDNGYAVAGDLRGKPEDEYHTYHVPWELNPEMSLDRIKQKWQRRRPAEVSEVVWLKLTEAGLDAARQIPPPSEWTELPANSRFAPLNKGGSGALGRWMKKWSRR